MRPHPHLTARGRRSGPHSVCAVAWAIVTLLVEGVSPLGAQEFPTDVTEYAAIRGGMTSFETPEVFELANIILSLTPAGQDRNSAFQGTPYYGAVRARFYAEQGPFYRGLVDSYRARVDLDAMRRWFEAHLSARWDSFRIVFSPLVAASHSAHMFVRDEFSEAVMLTASPPFVESYVEDPDLRRPARRSCVGGRTWRCRMRRSALARCSGPCRARAPRRTPETEQRGSNGREVPILAPIAAKPTHPQA